MSSPGLQEKGFLASLFDFGFTTFVTLRFLKVIYVVIMVLIGLFSVGLLLRAFTQGVGASVLALILVPLGALLYLVLARIYLELLALLFRIGENTTLIAAQLGAAGGQGPSSGLPPFGGQGYGGTGPRPGYGPPVQ